MDLSETIRIWRRRWILTLVLLTLALAGTVAALRAIPRSYAADSSVVLLASPSDARQNGSNPYLSFSPSLTLTADAVSRELIAPVTVSDLAAMGYGDVYTVALPPYTTTTTGSVLLVAVTGNDKAAVEHTLQGVTHEISVKLAQLQRGVTSRRQIRAATLSASPQATLSIGQTARPLVAVITPMLLLALGIPVIADGWKARRRIRKVLSQEPKDGADRLAYGPRVATERQEVPYN
jgi:hypothetical protein